VEEGGGNGTSRRNRGEKSSGRNLDNIWKLTNTNPGPGCKSGSFSPTFRASGSE
jgi:hypothetical protein